MKCFTLSPFKPDSNLLATPHLHAHAKHYPIFGHTTAMLNIFYFKETDQKVTKVKFCVYWHIYSWPHPLRPHPPSSVTPRLPSSVEAVASSGSWNRYGIPGNTGAWFTTGSRTISSMVCRSVSSTSLTKICNWNWWLQELPKTDPLLAGISDCPEKLNMLSQLKLTT